MCESKIQSKHSDEDHLEGRLQDTLEWKKESWVKRKGLQKTFEKVYEQVKQEKGGYHRYYNILKHALEDDNIEAVRLILKNNQALQP
mmetsp:Transcript_40778/g.39371  ORF Transcript_40778/g.39371 Transcript_40778/m.39371 type:complete len:87 (-) Transcript_40778:157-417(-)